MEQRPAPFCDNCIVLLQVRHILTECPTYNDVRWVHFPNMDGDFNEMMRAIVAESDQCNFDATKLIALLTVCNILDMLWFEIGWLCEHLKIRKVKYDFCNFCKSNGKYIYCWYEIYMT